MLINHKKSNNLKGIVIKKRLMSGQVRPSMVLINKHPICDFICNPPIEVLNNKKLIDQKIVSDIVPNKKAIY